MRFGRRATPAPVARFSEPFPPHGALAAKGAENLLGRPRLDPLVVLVREAVQNSWDARRAGEPLSFGVALHHLSADQRRSLRAKVFPDPPAAATRLAEVLGRDELRLLSLTDRGALGLAGPVRADRPARTGEPSNFVDLLFNIGQPAERELGGGTYGFGRTISFVVSEARAVVVHSRTGDGRRRHSRFIAAAFTDHYADGRRRFTGRHWWGDVATDAVEPIVGDEADALASSLGLPTFAPHETGTTIAVVAPDLRGRTPEQACRFLASALTWNFWPKMVPSSTDEHHMAFSVSLDGVDLAVPKPEELPPLGGLAACLRAVRSAEAGSTGPAQASGPDHRVEAVVLPRTGETIGWLALARRPVQARPAVDEGEDEESELGPSAPFAPPAHHVALLRQPELVVEYLATAELAGGTEEYVGVFKPRRELDRAFARAEPPTHDGWNANLVPETKLRRYVNVALRTIRDTAGDFAGPVPDAAGAARIADALDALFRTAAAPPSRRTATVTVTHVTRLDGEDDRTDEIEFDVEHAPGSSGTVVEAVAAVATHDGWTLERDAARAPVPPPPVSVVGFRRPRDRRLQEQRRLTIVRGEPTRWIVRVRGGGDGAVGVDLVPTPLAEDGP